MKLCSCLFLCLALLSGCASTTGTLENNNYTSPAGNFVVKIPYESSPMGRVEIRDFYDEKQLRGFVSITVPWQPMIGIKYNRNETALRDRKEVIQKAFKRISEDNLIQRSKEASLIYDEWILLDGNDVYFTITSLPSAAPYTTNGKAGAAEQCLALFFNGHYGYLVSIEGHTLQTVHTKKDRLSSTHDTVKYYRNLFDNLYRGITFKN